MKMTPLVAFLTALFADVWPGQPTEGDKRGIADLQKEFADDLDKLAQKWGKACGENPSGQDQFNILMASMISMEAYASFTFQLLRHAAPGMKKDLIALKEKTARHSNELYAKASWRRGVEG